jgi:hypothetical protein
VSTMWLTRGGAAALVAAVLSSGCGEFARQSQSPSQLVIDGILTARGAGAVPTTFESGPLLSDVPAAGETVFDDFGQATLRVILRDPGPSASPTAPSSLNDVTITRYTVTYTRAGGPNGQNTPGVDVPRPIDGAVTFTVPVGQAGAGVVELVRHVAKLEAPLAVLGSSPEVLTMIAEVTFHGRDQAGNDLSATGSVQINFANFN